MQKTSLQDQARLFAQDLSDLLNGTVTDGISISATTFPNAPREVLLGCGVGRNKLTPQPIPLSRNRNKANVYLTYMHRCGLDDDDTHLATLISTMNLYTSEEISNESLLLGIDYTRDPKNDFPRAHLHVAGERNDLDAIYLGSARKHRTLRQLHLPVGGSRYRPTLEDLLEFVILEEMATPRQEWKQAIAKHRGRWQSLQLRAAVRNNPEEAAEELKAAGWKVTAPT